MNSLETVDMKTNHPQNHVHISWDTSTMMPNLSSLLAPHGHVLLRSDAVARISANDSAAFDESRALIGQIFTTASRRSSNTGPRLS